MTRESQAPLLVVEDLIVAYGNQPVLEGVSLTARRGEISAVIGSSGSGKSTLLRCIVGLLSLRMGRILIGGRDLSTAPNDERESILRTVGFAFQNAALLNSMTTGENVALPIVEAWGTDEATALMLARIRLASVGLVGVADRMPNELSPEMRKRAGIARALALDPPLLLLDEPTTGLDPTAARALDEVVLGLKRRSDNAIVVVSHDVDSITTIADRVIILADGKVLAAGTLNDVRANPHELVQAFFHRSLLRPDSHSSLLDQLEWRQ